MVRRTLLLLTVAALAGCRKTAPSPRDELDRKFTTMMTGVVLEGRSWRPGSDKLGDEERYFIDGVSKLAGDTWLLKARFQYRGRELPIPVPVTVLWAGDTPMLSLTDVGVPGMGSYTARVVLSGDQYAGTWRGKKAGGQIFGRIVTQQ
jgi:hypothetical protein